MQKADGDMAGDPHGRGDPERTRFAAERAEVDEQKLEDLLGTVSHDLKSPLSAIMMTAATLGRMKADDSVRPQLRRKAETLQRCAERMARVIDELLDLANLQSGRFEIEASAQDAAAVIDASLANVREAAQERGVSVRANVDGTLPRIVCDRDRVVQALTGLLENAYCAAPEGGAVEVAARRCQSDVLYSVEGGGANESSAEANAGAGERGRRKRAALALTLAKGIVAAHGGRIWLEPSGSSGGTRVSFTIPAAAGT